MKASRDTAAPPLAASRPLPASSGSSLTPHRSPPGFRGRGRGFSLIEVLLAIFILGIGVISIAALFPAGIAQQRRTADDILGPIVANNAIELIRTKVRPGDFGTFEEFPDPDLAAPTGAVLPNISTIPGDWAWMRPGIVFEDDIDEPDGQEDSVNERGMLDIFSYQQTIVETGASQPIPFTPGLARASENADGYQDVGGTPVLWGIPYNTTRHSMSPGIGSSKTVPYFTITQQERYYPMQSQRHGDAAVRPESPQYVWDCMFRRFGGRIYVAVFVYRVNISGGGGAAGYVVPQNQGASSTVPPLPISLDLVEDPGTGAAPPPYCSGGPWDAYGLPPDFSPTDARVYGNAAGLALNLQNHQQAWQQSGQWLLDQNLNIHRVLSASRLDDAVANPVEVELVRPAPPVLGYGDRTIPFPDTPATGTPTYYHDAAPVPGTGEVIDNVVSNIWYIPLTIDLDLFEDADLTPDTPATLTPVYATVQEL